MMKRKSKYTMTQNIAWMIGNAWRICKSVLTLCVLCAAAAVAVNLTELFVAPQILSKVEQAAPVAELIGTILLFTVLLFLAKGLKSYLALNTLYGRVEVRTGLINQVEYKNNTTSYPNTLDPERIKMYKGASHAMSGNAEPSEHIWETLTLLLGDIAGFVIYLLLLVRVEPVMMAVVMVTTLVSYLVARRTSSWNFAHREEEREYTAKLSYIQKKSESINLAKDIRIFGLGGWLEEIYDSTMRLYEGFILRRERVQLLGNLADVALSVARNGLAYWYLLNMALDQGLSASEFLLYFSAIGGFANWITGILNDSMTLRREALDLTSIREYLEIEEPFCFAGGKQLPKAQGYELRLENVSFCYPKATKNTIDHMNLTVHAGEKLAIVGLNGAGKTTLVKLLCGLLDPTEGRVLLNGQDIRQLDRREYYRLFSAVFQDFSVLSASVAQNISQQAQGYDVEKINRCIEQAGLTEKISQLPQGIETKVGREVYEDGVLFSGGQTQRLMLARALYKDGGILLLDEPTAALDPIAENDIYLKYDEMSKGKTSLFISHRLASTRFCDRIIFLENGGICEEGTHEQLLQQGGGYAKLFEIQSRYYKEGKEF